MLRIVMSDSQPSKVSVGDKVKVEVGVIAHGGHFIAHHDGLTIFVRGADTGEVVLVEIDEITKKIARGHVVEVERASSNRIEPRCQYYINSACGGCDFQHLTQEHQGELKVKVVADSMKRIGGIDITPESVRVPGDGFDWRVRMDFDASPGGRLAMHPARSNLLTEINECAIAAKEMDIERINVNLEQKRGAWGERVRVGLDDSGHFRTTLVKASRLTHQVFDQRFDVSLESFWQPHRLAPEMLVSELERTLRGEKGERIFDLYGGVGLFSAFISKMVGESGEVILVESDESSIKDAERMFRDSKVVRVITSEVKNFLGHEKQVDRIVLDPPRTGAGSAVVKEMVRLAPKQILYISCDPATLARDAKELVEAGYAIESLRVLDLFPNTEHVESVANFIINR